MCTHRLLWVHLNARIINVLMESLSFCVNTWAHSCFHSLGLARTRSHPNSYNKADWRSCFFLFFHESSCLLFRAGTSCSLSFSKKLKSQILIGKEMRLYCNVVMQLLPEVPSSPGAGRSSAEVCREELTVLLRVKLKPSVAALFRRASLHLEIISASLGTQSLASEK